MSLKYLPKAVRNRLRPLPQWAAVGIRPQDALIRVELCSSAGRVEVTSNHVVAALKPFTVAMGMRDLDGGRSGQLKTGVLKFKDMLSGRTLGSLQLERIEPAVGTAHIGFFRVQRHRQRCVGWPYRAWNEWLQNRTARRQADPGNFSMGESLQAIMIFYILPRPVVLVSVDDGQYANIFPMDLIGPLGPDVFTLALRNTSRSVETMQRTGRIALSSLSAADVGTAYALAAHHRRLTEWDKLPFAVGRSERFGLPVMAEAMAVRELEIIDHTVSGSHTFFVGRVVTHDARRAGAALCHTSGLHQHFRSRHRRPLPPAT